MFTRYKGSGSHAYESQSKSPSEPGGDLIHVNEGRGQLTNAFLTKGDDRFIKLAPSVQKAPDTVRRSPLVPAGDLEDSLACPAADRVPPADG